MFERPNRSTRGPEHNPKVATEPDDLRRVPNLVAAAGKPLHALDIHPDLARSAFDGREWAGEAHKSRVEAVEITPDLLLLVAGGVSGHEEELDLVSIGC